MCLLLRCGIQFKLRSPLFKSGAFNVRGVCLPLIIRSRLWFCTVPVPVSQAEPRHPQLLCPGWEPVSQGHSKGNSTLCCDAAWCGGKGTATGEFSTTYQMQTMQLAACRCAACRAAVTQQLKSAPFRKDLTWTCLAQGSSYCYLVGLQILLFSGFHWEACKEKKPGFVLLFSLFPTAFHSQAVLSVGAKHCIFKLKK